MSGLFVRFHNVTFEHDSATEPLFENVSLHIGPGFSGVVGANGTGKTTLLRLATGLLTPQCGTIEAPSSVMYCPQRTDEGPDQLPELIAEQTRSACQIKDRLGLSDDWPGRWASLSHGERKRAQIAVALWREPSLLAIDEPTNHLDSDARDVIAEALRAFHGIGLLVSHDRELLDSLCRQCFFTEPPLVIVRPGGITKAMAAAKSEQIALQRDYAARKHLYRKLRQETSRRGEVARRSGKLRSKKGLAPKDHDAREKKDRARVSGKDAVAGRQRKQMKGRVARARQDLAQAVVKKDHTLGIWLPESVSKRNFVFRLEPGSLPLGGGKTLSYPQLHIGRNDRTAITGPNGCGKSTLVRHIVASLNLPRGRVTYIPQEIDLSRSREILAQARELPKDRLGHLMTIVSRLDSRPDRLLESDAPSPGETRKLLLAIGMTYAPHIIIMDEPTNHMDLPSIQCLEEALSNCPCAVVLVSHDKPFLDSLTKANWIISQSPASGNVFTLQLIGSSMPTAL